MTLESELGAANEVARRNIERSLSLEQALFTIEADVSEFLKGKLPEIPKRKGPAEGVYARLHEFSRAYRALESVKEFLPVKTNQSQAAQWYAYGRRLARTGSPGHAHDMLSKAFYGTFPIQYRFFGSILLHWGECTFSLAGEKQLRLDVASEWVPVLYVVAQKEFAQKVEAQMLRMAVESRDRALVRGAHGALSNMYERLKNEKFAQYHAAEAKRIQ